MSGVRALIRILVEERRTPPGSDEGRLHVRFHMRRRTGRPDRQIALAVLLRIAARFRAALFVPTPIVSLYMLGQMIGPHEPFITHRTCESFLTRVRAEVPLELIGPREPLPAEQPVADERPLARVPSQVRLQMRRLPVDFAASRYMTAVDVLLA